jgi:uroporphyrinogen decarboxylase
MPEETMTPLERWLAVLKRQTPDRVPMDYWATPEVTERLMEHLGSNMLDKLHIDYPITVGPRYVGPPLPLHTDVFGVGYAGVNYGTGVYDEVVTYPLAIFKTVEEIEANYTWPDPDWWDYAGIPEQIKGREDHPIRGGGSEPFLKYKDLRGGEQAMMDLVENPEIVEYCLGKLFDLAYIETLRIFETIPGKVVISYVAEDMGSQTDLMFSPRHIRRFMLPGMKRMIDLIHQAGAFVFHHNDGNITRILPDMIELGIDVLNPIQWRAGGMDRESLKKQYGDKLVFHGAVDNQYTLPFGTVAEVRQEVADNLRILGDGGGYILAPCHNIQPVTPLENILAMYAAGYEMGWS